jgi:hypothetical protein
VAFGVPSWATVTSRSSKPVRRTVAAPTMIPGGDERDEGPSAATARVTTGSRGQRPRGDGGEPEVDAAGQPLPAVDRPRHDDDSFRGLRPRCPKTCEHQAARGDERNRSAIRRGVMSCHGVSSPPSGRMSIHSRDRPSMAERRIVTSWRTLERLHASRRRSAHPTTSL